MKKMYQNESAHKNAQYNINQYTESTLKKIIF